MKSLKGNIRDAIKGGKKPNSLMRGVARDGDLVADQATDVAEVAADRMAKRRKIKRTLLGSAGSDSMLGG